MSIENRKSNKIAKRGYFRRAYYYPLNIFNCIRVKTDGRKMNEYIHEVKRLLDIIYKELAIDVNVAHFEYYPRNRFLPLRAYNEHFDISYLSKDFNIVLLRVKVIPRDKAIEKIKDVMVW